MMLTSLGEYSHCIILKKYVSLLIMKLQVDMQNIDIFWILINFNCHRLYSTTLSHANGLSLGIGQLENLAEGLVAT